MMPDESFLFDLENIIEKKKVTEYDEVILEKASYPYLYHLSALRANILDWIPISSGERVLELSAGCGALTGALLQKAGHVTAVTETVREAELIRKRFADAGNKLKVCTQDGFAQREKQEYHKIFLIGQTTTFYGTIKEVRQLLAKNGTCYLADANRLGLKYFAGCQDEYQDGYFAGLQGFVGAAGNRSYTRKEYEAMLREAGFTEILCYYPYPDHKFPTSIYSDAWLPKPGELSDNQRNYDKDRYRLFDEKSVFDTIVKEDLFSEFANSFLFEATTGEAAVERVIYSRHANERAARFGMRTDILKMPDGSQKVMKYAQKEAGTVHLEHMEYSFRKLCACYDKENIGFCSCHKEGDGIAFPYLAGKTLQELLEQALREQQGVWIEETLKDYCRRIQTDGGERAFVLTEEFCEVFGRHPHMEQVLESLVCPIYCDIDLIFSNILTAIDFEKLPSPKQITWQVIDYEWSFAFPVPKVFVLYRAMYFAYYQIFSGSRWTMPELFALAGVTEEQQRLFLKMEEHFQSYIAGGAFPVRNMQRIMGTKVFRLGEEEAFAGRQFGLVKKISFHIDREEYQDGCIVCSGWALATDWHRNGAPVELSVVDEAGKKIVCEVSRSERGDVAAVMKLCGKDAPVYGFDCVFPIKKGEKWQIIFAKGHRKKSYRSLVNGNHHCR